MRNPLRSDLAHCGIVRHTFRGGRRLGISGRRSVELRSPRGAENGWIRLSVPLLPEPHTRTYEKSVRVSDAEMKTLDIKGDEFHPEWNFTIRPRSPAVNRSG